MTLKGFVKAAHFFITALSGYQLDRVFGFLEEGGGLLHSPLQYKCMEGGPVAGAKLLLELGLIDTEVFANERHRQFPMKICTNILPDLPEQADVPLSHTRKVKVDGSFRGCQKE